MTGLQAEHLGRVLHFYQTLETLKIAVQKRMSENNAVLDELQKIQAMPPIEQAKYQNYADQLSEWVKGRKETSDALHRALSNLTIGKSITSVAHDPVEVIAVGDESSSVIGELLICLFVRADRQAERLADFNEVFRTVWYPRYGRFGGTISVFNLVWSALDVWRITAWASAGESVAHALDAFSRFWHQ